MLTLNLSYLYSRGKSNLFLFRYRLLIKIHITFSNPSTTTTSHTLLQHHYTKYTRDHHRLILIQRRQHSRNRTNTTLNKCFPSTIDSSRRARRSPRNSSVCLSSAAHRCERQIGKNIGDNIVRGLSHRRARGGDN